MERFEVTIDVGPAVILVLSVVGSEDFSMEPLREGSYVVNSEKHIQPHNNMSKFYNVDIKKNTSLH